MAHRWQVPVMRRRMATCGLAAISITAAIALTACGSKSSAGPTTTASVVHCGSTKSAANVPVSIEVVHGKVACGDALTIERDYAKAIIEGKAPGNGGGGPVHVTGWICVGFNAPQVVKTGQASKCTKAGTEILAVLKLPKSS
jgi:hypothetical protein